MLNTIGSPPTINPASIETKVADDCFIGWASLSQLSIGSFTLINNPAIAINTVSTIGANKTAHAVAPVGFKPINKTISPITAQGIETVNDARTFAVTSVFVGTGKLFVNSQPLPSIEIAQDVEGVIHKVNAKINGIIFINVCASIPISTKIGVGSVKQITNAITTPKK